MLEKVREFLDTAHKAVQTVERFQGVIAEAANFTSFAIIQKEGINHLVFLTPDQATSINGLSVPLTGIDDIVPKVKSILLDALKRKVDEGVATLKPFTPPEPTKAQVPPKI